jgi:hypothetical protein
VLIYYVNIRGQHGLIAGITHMRVKRRAAKRRGSKIGYDFYILAEDNIKNNVQSHSPFSNCIRLCILVKAYDERSGREIRTWEVEEDKTLRDTMPISSLTGEKEIEEVWEIHEEHGSL